MFVAVLALSACGHSHDEGEPGTLALTVAGSALVESGITADKVVDGWAISFDRFLVSVGDFEAGHGHDNPEIVHEDETFYVFDLAKDSGGKGFALASIEVDGGHYDHYGYRVAPSADAKVVNADQADVDVMKAGGYAVWIKGSATKDADTRTFEWGFTVATVNDHCHSEAMVDGNTATVQFTLHGDRLFQDSLIAAMPKMTFQLIANADAGTPGDGVVTENELTAIDITGLPAGSYDSGSLALTNLWDYIEQEVTLMGQIDGDGECGVHMRQ